MKGTGNNGFEKTENSEEVNSKFLLLINFLIEQANKNKFLTEKFAYINSILSYTYNSQKGIGTNPYS